MTALRFAIVAMAVLIVTRPSLAFDPCEGLSGEEKEQCTIAQRVPDSDDPCRALSFRADSRERYEQCVAAKQEFDALGPGLNVKRIIDFYLCNKAHDWAYCMGYFVLPIPIDFPDPGPYAKEIAPELSTSERATLRKTLQAAVQANTKYLESAVDRLFGEPGK